MGNAREFGNDLLLRLLDRAVETTPGALGAGLVVGVPPEARAKAASTAPSLHVAAAVGVAVDLDPPQVAVGEGPVHEAVVKGEVLVLPMDGEQDGTGLDLTRYPGLTDRLEPKVWHGVTGLVVTPGEWGEELPVAFSVYLARHPDADVVGAADRWEALLSAALATVEYCSGEELRAEQMLQMIQYRRVVEQAKGLLMAATGQDAQAAFAVLSRASQHFNVRLRTLAVALVEHVGSGRAEHPDDPEAVVEPDRHERVVAAQVWSAMNRRDA